MRLKRWLKVLWLLLTGRGNVFIGDVPHCAEPYETKRNEWGGNNYKYYVMPGQRVRALRFDPPVCPTVVWDEIVSLSKHCGIPAYRVHLETGYSIICSPRNSIVIKRDGEYIKADMLAEDITGELVPCSCGRSNVTQDVRIVKVEDLQTTMDMWDITLKNNTIFLADDRMFIYDTVAVHVPVTKGGVKDVLNMSPSNNLIAEQTGRLVAQPEHSAIVGIYELSKTSEGRKRINAVLPDEYDFKGPVSKSEILAMLEQIALDKGADAAKVINAIRHLGDTVAYENGLSIGLSDLAPMKQARDEIMPEMLREIRSIPEKELTQDKLNAIYTKYIDQGNKALTEHFKNANSELADIYLSKARGSQSQYRDMIFSPVAVSARRLPNRPIKHSYIEGLTPAEYGIASHGARLGVLGRSQGTAMPGALGKELLATANTLVINKAKGNSMGEIMAELGKWKKGDIIDRYLSRDVLGKNDMIVAKKDTLITPNLFQKIQASGVDSVWVYSPLQSSSADGGIPAMAYGINHKGVLPTEGENIGANSAFALVEPLFMSSMSSFHTGSSLGSKRPAYPRIKQLVELTQSIPDKATLAETSGKVSDIKADSLGGHTVIIGGDEHYILPKLDVLVKIGDTVNKGDLISGGTPDPKEIAEYKGLEHAQKYMVDELQAIVPTAKRRALETIVEGITRYATVTDPGDSSYLPGDNVLISALEKQNKDLVNKIKYDYLFKGVNYLPQNTQSWLSKFNFRNIKREFTKDVISGAETNTSSYEPAPAMAKGIDFGKGKAGRY